MKCTYLILLVFIFSFSASAQLITTVAGNGILGYSGDGADARSAEVYNPYYTTTDDSGNIYIADSYNNLIRKVNALGIISTYVSNYYGWLGLGGGFAGDGGPATAARLNFPVSVAVDHFGNLFISDQVNYRIRKVTASGIITTIAGTGSVGFSGEGGPATAARISSAQGMCVDDTGNLFFADRNNHRIRKVSVSGIITTVAGTGVGGYSGDGGPATAAQFGSPCDVAIDRVGNLYVADEMNNCIRKINTTGVISRFAGNHLIGYTGDGGPATLAQLHWPVGVAVDKSSGPGAGSVYIADCNNHRVRVVNTSGIISTVAGTGFPGYNGDDILAVTAQLYSPYNVAVSGTGAVYITDAGNTRIRKIGSDFNIAVLPGATVCPATVVTFTTSPTPGCTSPTYQWIKNGIVSGSGSSYSYLPATGDSVRCVRTCSGGSPQNSNTIIMTVSPTVLPTISITSSSLDTICAGSFVTFNALSTFGGSLPTYQWKVNGVTVGSGSSYIYAPSNGDSVRCILTSSLACATPTIVSSGTIRIYTRPSTIPSVSITAAPGDRVCSGTPVFYTAAGTGGGTAPRYQWMVNGVNTGTGSSYTYVPSHRDSIRCIFTSNAACAMPTTISSSSITMTVDSASILPSISIAATPGTRICEGQAVLFTASTTSGGLTPFYQWRVNGVNVGAGGYVYTYSPLNGDTIMCRLTSSIPCLTVGTVNSNKIGMVTDTFITPSISISGPALAVPGTVVGLTASVANAGSSYTINWMNYGVVFRTTSIPTTTYTKTTGTDVLTAKVVSTSSGCYDTTVSEIILITPISTLGLSNIEERDNLTVYPNPASNHIMISSTELLTDLSIINTLGQKVYHNSYNQKQVDIDLSQFPSGMYLLRINDRYARSIVKQ